MREHRLTLRRSLALLAFVVSNAALGQTTNTNTTARVYRDRVEPHWFENNDKFWYRLNLEAEQREFILVDAVKGIRAPAFDHTRLAKALSDKLGEQVDASKLPIDNITFTAGEVKDPRRNVPLSLALGTGLVITVYLLANVAYLVTLPLAEIQQAPSDRVATAALNAIFPGFGAVIMAVAIMISTFGCNNGLVLAGARAYFAMARDGVFFNRAGELNAARVPAWFQATSFGAEPA